MYSSSDYTVSSNNSTNDNKYNAQKAKKYGLKSILKPLLRMIKKSKPVQNHHYCPECEDNSANEDLENTLIEEMNQCHPSSAVFVCDEEGNWDVSPITNKTYVPVHFARTEAGTFFWTSMMKCADSDLLSSNCFTQCQNPVEQMPIVFQDRWVQA